MAFAVVTVPGWQEFEITGELARRTDHAVTRLVQLREAIRQEERINRLYGYGEISGNWLETMGIICRHFCGKHEALFRDVADDLLAHQEPYGGFCKAEPKAFNISHWVGDQRSVGGLLAAWRHFHDERYLASARRVAQALLDYWPTDFDALAVQDWGKRLLTPKLYFYSTSNLCDLYAETGDERYLALARRNAAMCPRLTPEAFGEHADGRMMNLMGYLRLYELTGEAGVLQAVEADQKLIARRFQWSSGGIPETLPDNGLDEACQTANWARLNLMLWRITGREEYLSVAERTWLNHLYFDQLPDTGGFCYGRTLRDGGDLCHRTNPEGTGPFEMWYCCSETAPRAMVDIGRHAVAMTANGPAICLWIGGRFALSDCRIEIAHDLTPGQPAEAIVHAGRSTTLSIRLPARSSIRQLRIEGLEAPPRAEGAWLRVPLSTPTTRIELDLAFATVLEEKIYRGMPNRPLGDANNPDADWNEERPRNYRDRRLALHYGPWMLKSDIGEEKWFLPNRRYQGTLPLAPLPTVESLEPSASPAQRQK